MIIVMENNMFNKLLKSLVKIVLSLELLLQADIKILYLLKNINKIN